MRIQHQLGVLLFITFATLSCGDNLSVPTDTDAPDEILSCFPNLDGQLDGAELPIAIGVPTAYLISPEGTQVDVAGSVDSAGRWVWNWSERASDDEVAHFTPVEITDRWYADHFPDGDFAAPVDATGSIEAVYRRDATALWFFGLASAQPNPAEGRTLIVYDEPISIYVFPMRPGVEWRSSSDYSDGVLRGQPIAGSDVYVAAVDALGRMALPHVTFAHAYRVRFEVTANTIVGDPITQRQVSFLTECFGEVAQATSRLGEEEEDFQTASQVRRYSFASQ